MPITRRTLLPVVGIAAATAGLPWLGRRAMAATAAPAPAPAATPSGPQYAPRTLGSASAPVKVLEYFSLTCTHCSHFGTTIMPEVKAKLVDTGKAQFVYHDFPLDQVALKAAQVARYLPLDEYYPFIEALFASQNDWAFQPGENYHDSIFKYAALAGMDQATYNKAWNDKALAQWILDGQKKDETAYHIDATPTFIINGKIYPGEMDYPTFARRVAQATAGS